MTKIKYTQSTVAHNPTFRTERFGNLLSDTWQGEVEQNSQGTWDAWLFNFSHPSEIGSRFDLKSKAAATRWVNKQLKEKGI